MDTAIEETCFSAEPTEEFFYMKRVICMKWGQLYEPDYVNRLYAMARRNLTGDLKFVCLTDNTEGTRAEVEYHPCPDGSLPAPYDPPGVAEAGDLCQIGRPFRAYRRLAFF